MSVRVVGIGNELRGDDAAGLQVARRLRALAPGLDVQESGGEPADLLDALHGADEVVLVDAVRSGAPPGTVHRLDAAAGPLPPPPADASTHGLGLAASIELCRALGSLPARCTVYGIEGRAFAVGARLSDEVDRAASALAAELRASLAAAAAV